jgi:hypothetical protein
MQPLDLHPKLRRVDELDGIRGILALWVAVTHILCWCGFAVDPPHAFEMNLCYQDWEAIEPGNSREGTAGGFGRRGFCGQGNQKSGLVFPHGGHSARMGNLDIRIIPD